MKANQSRPNEQITNRNSHGIKRRGIKTSDLQFHIDGFLYYFTGVVTAILPHKLYNTINGPDTCDNIIKKPANFRIS